MPLDEGTPLEHAEITGALTRISDLTEKFGKRREFDAIPVIVVTEDARKTDRVGYCDSLPFIALNRSLFVRDKVNSSLAPVLLHEIGHCYFHRGHFNGMIVKPGFSFVFYDNSDPMHQRMYLYPGICQSIMCAHSANPVQLLEYYVGELLGRPRATSVADMEQFAPLNFTAHR